MNISLSLSDCISVTFVAIVRVKLVSNVNEIDFIFHIHVFFYVGFVVACIAPCSECRDSIDDWCRYIYKQTCTHQMTHFYWKSFVILVVLHSYRNLRYAFGEWTLLLLLISCVLAYTDTQTEKCASFSLFRRSLAPLQHFFHYLGSIQCDMSYCLSATMSFVHICAHIHNKINIYTPARSC